MNKTVAKFASKAGFDVGIHDGMILGNFSDMHKCQKLVELIIEKCADIAREYDLPKLGGPGAIVANRLEEHFGVEE